MTIENKLIKKPHSTVAYTPEMIEELRLCSDNKTGPLYFMENFVYIQHPIQGKIKFVLYDYQRELLDVYHGYRYAVAMVSRQMGKSALASAYLLWYAMFKPDSTILVAAHKYMGAQEIMQRIRYSYENVPDHIRCGVTSYNKGSIDFDNGSRIISQTTTENTGRGLSLTCIYLDEFSFVRPKIAREFWTSISPTLSTGGKCIITSTPNVDDDQFADIWNGSQKTIDEHGNETNIGANGFKGYMATWSAHPDRDEAWAEQEKAKIGQERFDREHLCKFVSFNETLISAMCLANLKGIEPIRKEGEIRWYSELKNEKSYVVTLDPSMGTGGDFSAIQVLEMPTMKQVAEWRHNKTRIEEQIKILRDILITIEKKSSDIEIYWTVENNSVGEAALVAIREADEDTFPGTFMHDPNRSLTRKSRKGYTTTNKTKLEACSKFKFLVENNRIHLYSKSLIHELKYFIARGKSYEASIGETDDLVMAMLIAIRVAQQVAQWEDGMMEAIGSGLDSVFHEEEDEPMPVIV